MADEHIVSSAIKYRTCNMDKYDVVVGRRHSDCVAEFAKMDIRLADRKEIQGFMTNTGRFVDRYEAYHIAVVNGQTQFVPGKHQLFSEDIY